MLFDSGSAHFFEFGQQLLMRHEVGFDFDNKQVGISYLARFGSETGGTDNSVPLLSQTQIHIIVGVSVGVLLVLLAGVGFCLYKRKQAQKNQQNLHMLANSSPSITKRLQFDSEESPTGI
jgi:hypothetical protein